jgi:diphthine synthase
MISLGLGDAKDITVRGLELVKGCARLYLESYTAILGIDAKELEAYYGKEVIIADRLMVESASDDIMQDADTLDIGFLVVGDVFAATTHHDLYLRAIGKGYKVNVVNNASIMNAVACCGLQLYQFGLTVSICFFDGTWRPYSFYDKFVVNYKAGMHTLCLLDIKVKEQTPDDIAKGIFNFQPPRFMTINQAIDQIFETEGELKTGCLTPQSWAIGMARVGQATQQIVSGPLEELLKVDFGGPLHSLVLPAAELHPLEIEMFFHFWYDQDGKEEACLNYRRKKEEDRIAAIEQRRVAEAEAYKRRVEEAKAAKEAALRKKQQEEEEEEEESSEYYSDEDDDEDDDDKVE